MENKKLMANIGLYRSKQQRMIGGVIGGIAERFGWNANFLRLLFVVISVASAAFPGILVYLVLWVLMPTIRHMPQQDIYSRPPIDHQP